MSQDAIKPASAKQTGASLRQAFPGYFPPSEALLRTLLTSGLVVFDTNPLLDTYKLTGTAREEFLNALRALGDRLWIPHQVGLEFLRSRARIIDQGSAFPSRFRTAASNLHKEVQDLKEHRRLKDEEVSGIKQAIEDAITRILDDHADLYAFGVDRGISIDDDPVFKEIEQITAGKIGPQFSKPVDAAKIGNQRIRDKVPPGYSDASDKEQEGALGDYFVWEQTLIEAERRRLPVLFITNEKKEDWIRKEGSYIRGPRPELVDELLTRTGQPFHLIDVKAFLFHADKYLPTKVSPSTIKQAESVQKQDNHPTASTLERLLESRIEDDATIRGLARYMSRSQRRTLKKILEGHPAVLHANTESFHNFTKFLIALSRNTGEIFEITPARENLYFINPCGIEGTEEEEINDADLGDEESNDPGM